MLRRNLYPNVILYNYISFYNVFCHVYTVYSQTINCSHIEIKTTVTQSIQKRRLNIHIHTYYIYCTYVLPQEQQGVRTSILLIVVPTVYEALSCVYLMNLDYDLSIKGG